MGNCSKNARAKPWRLGVVSYLNSKPLVQGLDGNPQISMVYDVPARLPARLDEGSVDVALVPVVDLAIPDRDWKIVSDACIGCDGETLTVRVFSRVSPDQVRRLHVDGDSHTSVILAKIVFGELYGNRLEVLPFHDDVPLDDCEAILLIGDKVVTQRLIGFDVQTDLGSCWKTLTSLPFVFAVWAAPRGLEIGDLGDWLSEARDTGVRSAALIAADCGPGMGFPVELAKRYLTARLKFKLEPKFREGMKRFFHLAEQHGMLPKKELLFA